MPPISIPYTLAPGAMAPARATPGAAGMDLHAHLPYGGPLVLPPGERARIATGLHLALPFGYEGQIRPRSGLAWEHGLTVLNAPGTIDSDFRGEVRVLVINHGQRDVTITDGDRIAQLVVCPVADVALCPADSLPPTERGAGGFGSTGTGPALDDYGAGGYAKGYRAGYDDATEDRALLEARVRALEAEVSEARAERDKWGAELDTERAAVAAYLRREAKVITAALRAADAKDVCTALDRHAAFIAVGNHRAGGAR